MTSSGWLVLGACVLIGSLAPGGTQGQVGGAAKAITRLPPAAFPELPLPIREALEKRGCRIPQGAENPKPHNVISGSFIRPNQIDWAVLCSKDGSSAVLVFTEGSPLRVHSLDREDDRTSLRRLGDIRDTSDKRIGYARVIALAERDSIPDLSDGLGGKGPQNPDHDGIEDIFSETASVVLYWDSRKWLKLQGGD